MPKALDFGFLDTLSWDQVFSLQAFLEHATLSAEEHAAIFGIEPPKSEQILESLGNLLLIEPAKSERAVGEPLVFDTVVSAARYRIRPVLVPIVLRALRGRNLVE